MAVRIAAPDENLKAFSQPERYQMMNKKNVYLGKLKDLLDLELQ
jgi:DNA polymerase-3 subunit gamma/tau